MLDSHECHLCVQVVAGSSTSRMLPFLPPQPWSLQLIEKESDEPGCAKSELLSGHHGWKSFELREDETSGHVPDVGGGGGEGGGRGPVKHQHRHPCSEGPSAQPDGLRPRLNP